MSARAAAQGQGNVELGEGSGGEGGAPTDVYGHRLGEQHCCDLLRHVPVDQRVFSRHGELVSGKHRDPRVEIGLLRAPAIVLVVVLVDPATAAEGQDDALDRCTARAIRSRERPGFLASRRERLGVVRERARGGLRQYIKEKHAQDGIVVVEVRAPANVVHERRPAPLVREHRARFEGGHVLRLRHRPDIDAGVR